MKYLKLFESFNKSEIDKICRIYDIRNYTINTDGSIDVNGDDTLLYGGVGLGLMDLKKLPLKFNKVDGWFNCNFNMMKSLEGSPIEVNGDFNCVGNELTSFKFAPRIIRGDFYCSSNYIKTFEYFPSFVKEWFYCNDNPIYEVWYLFHDTSKIELLNDFDIFRDEDTNNPGIVMDRLNDFLLTIGKPTVEKVDQYKNI